MTDQEMEAKLKNALMRLNKTAEQVAMTNGYTSEVKKIKLLMEFIREQIKSEHSSHTARSVR